MRKIFKERSLMASVPQEVTEAVDQETLRVKNVDALEMFYDGKNKRPTKATILSVIVLHYMSLPQEQRDHILHAGVEQLRAMMEGRPSSETRKPLTAVELDAPSPRVKRGGR